MRRVKFDRLNQAYVASTQIPTTLSNGSTDNSRDGVSYRMRKCNFNEGSPFPAFKPNKK